MTHYYDSVRKHCSVIKCLQLNFHPFFSSFHFEHVLMQFDTSPLEAGPDMFDTELFDELLDSGMYDDPHDILGEPLSIPYESPVENALDIQRYEEAKYELMQLKFGGRPLPEEEEKGPIPETSELCQSPIPQEYLEASDLPYSLKISDLPSYSRVETQIKLKLTVSPAPPQFLLHVPRDTVAKPKLTLLSPEVPPAAAKQMLFLETYVVGSNPEEQPYSYQVCRRCMRRELKRASRRKAGAGESSGWTMEHPKRAIIFNCKEVVSFPQPSAVDESFRTMELFSRIVCYCRHHGENKGFRLFCVLKDSQGRVLAKSFSDPIMIMDRKKGFVPTGGKTESLRSGKASPNSDEKGSNISDSSEVTSSTTTAIPPDTTEHHAKRKRTWSPGDTTSQRNPTFFDQQRRQASVASVKKEPISPMSSDTLSPQNNLYASSATSVFSTTPEKKYAVPVTASTQIQQRQQTSHQQPQQNLQSTSGPSPSLAPAGPAPSIQRIIPAQGPVRGGIEVTLLGANFRPGMKVKFGASLSLATHCWSPSTLVTYLPPASQPGPVLVTIEEGNSIVDTGSQQIFTYTDDSDRQLIELALQIVGLQMNGRLEDAKNIAKRIIGNNHDKEGGEQANNVSPSSVVEMSQGSTAEWFDEASIRMKMMSKEVPEELIVRFLELLDLPNSPVMSPNWAVCTTEGQTMLHLACMKGYMQLAKYLIHHGSKVNFEDSNGLTPLHMAYVYGQRDMIRLLVRCNASPASNLPVSLQEMSDPNVLDLLTASITRSSSIDSLESWFEREETPIWKESGYESEESELADNEESADEAPANVLSCQNNKKKSLWTTVKGAFSVVSDDTTTIVAADETQTLVDEQEQLPSYDDLFPNGAASTFRSLWSGMREKKRQQQRPEPAPVEEAILLKPQGLNSDTRLMFFWLPFLLILLLIVVGSHLQLIQLQQFVMVSNAVESARDFVGGILLGNERFTRLLNDNLQLW